MNATNLIIIFAAYFILTLAGQMYIYHDLNNFIKNLYGKAQEK